MVSKFVWSALGSMRYNEKEVAAFAITPAISTDKKGYLWKKGEYGGGGFKRRWFTLKGNMLFYFKAPNDREAIGFIFLEGCVVESGKEAGMPHGVRLIYDGQGSRTYILCADTEEEQKSWITALQRSSYRYLRAQIAQFIRIHPDLAGAADPPAATSVSEGALRMSLEPGQHFADVHQTAASPRRARAATASAVEAPAVPSPGAVRLGVPGSQASPRLAKATSTPPPSRSAGPSGSPPRTRVVAEEEGDADAMSTTSRQSLEDPILAAEDGLQENLSEAIEGTISSPSTHHFSRSGFGSLRNASVRSQAGPSGQGGVPVRDDTWTCAEVSIGCLGLPLEREDRAPSTLVVVLISQADGGEWTEWARSEIVEETASPEYDVAAVFGRSEFALCPLPGMAVAGPPSAASSQQAAQLSQALAVAAVPPSPLGGAPSDWLAVSALGSPVDYPPTTSAAASTLQVPGAAPAAGAAPPCTQYRVRFEIRVVEGGDGSRLRPWFHADCCLHELAASDGVCMDLVSTEGRVSAPKISLAVVRTAGDTSCTGRRGGMLRSGSTSKRSRKVRNALDISRYRIATVDGRRIVVEEQMEESRHALPVPVQLLRVLMAEDTPGLVELDEMGVLAGDYEALRQQLLTERRTALEAYRDALASLDAYRETSFKPSTAKKSRELQFVTTNCHAQRICVHTDKGVVEYETVTLGAPAAHSLSFKKGGLKRLLSSAGDGGGAVGVLVDVLTRGVGPTDSAALALRLRRNLIQECLVAVEKHCDAFATALLDVDVAAAFPAAEAVHNSVMQLCELWEDKAVEHATRVAAAAEAKVEMTRTPENCNKLSDGSQRLLQKVQNGEIQTPEQRSALLEAFGHIRTTVLRISREVISMLSIALMQEVAQQPGVTELIMRRDVCFAQALSALVTCFSGSCAIRLGSPLFPFWPQQIEAVGYLAHFESLLSTIGDEQGMLEDMAVAVDDLAAVKFKFALASPAALPPSSGEWCAGVSGSRAAIVVTLSLPPARFAQLTDSLRRGRLVSVRPVLFTQGVNEAQTWANKMGDTTLQDYTNKHAFVRTEAYCRDYFKFCFRVCIPGGCDMSQELRMLEILLAQLKLCAEGQRKGKNVELLKLSEELARRMNGGRLTSCKSGKDRTSMAVTLEQCVILQQQHGMASSHMQAILDAMRRDGTRRRNVAKNIGESMYAFNSLQIMTLPKLYRPPKGTFGSAQS